MIKLDYKTIDAMPAGRGMDVCIAVLVMGKRIENYCIVRPLPLGNSSVDWDQCERCALPCPMPRYSTDWRAMREVVDALPDFELTRLTKNRWRCHSTFTSNCLYGRGDTPELAICRAALKWAVDREKE